MEAHVADDTATRGTWLLPPLDRRALSDGARAYRGPGVAVAVWGFVTGVAMVRGGLSAAWATVMSLATFAGSAQLAALPLLATSAPLPIVWVTAALVNLRFLIFAAASRRYFATLPIRQRLALAYFNGDVPFAMFISRFGRDVKSGSSVQHGFYVGLAAVNYAAWQLGSLAGIAVGNAATEGWDLALAAYLALLAVLVPALDRWPAAAGVVLAGTLSIVTRAWPMRLGIPVSIVAGIAVASWLDARRQRSDRPRAHHAVSQS